MTLLKKFSETGQDIGSEDVPISETNFQQYMDQYGKDRAEGYKDAFADMMKQMRSILTRTDEFGEWRVSDQVAGRRIKKFHKEKSITLEKMVQLLSDSKLKP